MLKNRPILPTRVSPKRARRISWVQNARSSRRKGNRRRKRSQEKPQNVSQGREKDVIYTALIRLDNNDSRISVLFSLTSSCAASFAAFKDNVLEACGLASRKHV